MNGDSLSLVTLVQASLYVLEFIAIVNARLSVRAGYNVQRLGVLKLVPVAAQRATALAADLSCYTDNPRPESIRFAQRSQLAIGSQEALLRHVLGARPVAAGAGYDRPHNAHVPVVQLPERFAIAGKRRRHQFDVGRRVLVHARFTSGHWEPRVLKIRLRFPR
jgi:hypothetical protein